MTEKYVMAVDQGTTSTRAVIFSRDGKAHSFHSMPVSQSYPRPGWVEHSPGEIWESARICMKEAFGKSGLHIGQIHAIGVTNQRETTIVWDRNTGDPVYGAISWQCRRTVDICQRLKSMGLHDYVRESTGLVIDSYFSGTKISWILENVPGARDMADRGELMFGNVDTWLIWNMTGGRVHATDFTNASRTMLFNMNTLDWDDRLLESMNVPRSMMPDVRPSASHFGSAVIEGYESFPVPICAAVGDQQSSLFGQRCFASGDVKVTFGTGIFALMNTGLSRPSSRHGLVTTIAWALEDSAMETVDMPFALEGSVFTGGDVVTWLKDGLGIIGTSEESGTLASSVPDNGGVYLVPAFAGLGTPYWDMDARGIIVGLTKGSNRCHIARAALESMAYQSKDVLDVMEGDSGVSIERIKVDGKASENDFLMQFLSDITGKTVARSSSPEATALGAALMAGLWSGVYSSIEEIGSAIDDSITTFTPSLDVSASSLLHGEWLRAVERSKGWAR